MKTIFTVKILLLLTAIGTCTAVYSQAQTDRNKLWYDKPASNWNEALPIGNGFIGGMIFGRPEKERIQLNESTIWAGGPNSNIDTAARTNIDEVRRLLAQKKYLEAQIVANSKLGPKGNSGMPYQLAGDLYIDFPGQTEISNYRRDLDIGNATATVSYSSGGVNYKREYLTSFTHNVMLVRLSADRPGMISCRITLQSPLKKSLAVDDNGLILSGKGSDHENQKGQVRFTVMAKTKQAGGTSMADSSGLVISKADTAVVYLSMATNFINYHQISGNDQKKAQSILDGAFKNSFSGLRAAHQLFYKKYYDRVKLNLGHSASAGKPTNVRIAEFADGNDPQLAELYFQFGRYLLICSSQPGSQPTNLQGLWNGELKGPWDSKYTVNINTEMNYWPSEVTQLSELGTPLFNMIRDLSVSGRSAAKTMYGARGWMLHHNTDIWRTTGIVDGAFWGLWPMGGAWLTQHLWEHYLYTGDRRFLKQYYPIMKAAAWYYMDVLQKDPDHKWMVISPSISPENQYIGGKTPVSVAAGATMDNQLVYGLFTNLIKAAAQLKTDKAFSDSLQNYRNQLPPMQVGKHGQLQEWLEDFDNPDDKHRHVSHLYGLFPGNQISPFKHPKLFAAAKNSLVYRGDVSTGWSMAWKINLWARLLDGNHAYKLITDQIKPVTGGSGGTYPNLFDAHPPFQIDGNFGCTSGIAEMLLQSHDNALYLLPALPDAWPKGSVTGMMARGGFKVDMEWSDRKITKLVVHSSLGGTCRIRLNHQIGTPILKKATEKESGFFNQATDIKTPLIKNSGKDLSINLPQTWLYDLDTKAGQTYTII
ncbi:glycoside hydrolase family 95 protein [Pedobacter ginsengisoli]|uniref:glycoside hydrolase family 95 protein n=1 Tax=Pedobacter ginsengisoli TaxID=363852 RepID=UPI00254BC3D0|nr:glycoside hydrolase N-terminal domain-containing protein [Pedobacter ginsengisoli]